VKVTETTKGIDYKAAYHILIAPARLITAISTAPISKEYTPCYSRAFDRIWTFAWLECIMTSLGMLGRYWT
jgi:hypothetical protein